MNNLKDFNIYDINTKLTVCTLNTTNYLIMTKEENADIGEK